jgi:hypothetical protein
MLGCIRKHNSTYNLPLLFAVLSCCMWLQWLVLTTHNVLVLTGGCSQVFGLHDIYKRLLPFVQAWRCCQPHGSSSHGAGRSQQQQQQQPLPLYFATIDIRHCYDTIPHRVLCERVLPLVLREPAYVCGRYARVSYRPPRPDEAAAAAVAAKATVATTAAAAGESLHVRYLHCAFPLKDLDRLVQRSRGGESELVLQPWRKRCTILVNQESQSVVDRETILATIREHVTQNIIKVDGRYLRTKTGIPQGSVLSVMLCGLFYAHLENHLLRPVLPLGPEPQPPDEQPGANATAGNNGGGAGGAGGSDGSRPTAAGTSANARRRQRKKMKKKKKARPGTALGGKRQRSDGDNGGAPVAAASAAADGGSDNEQQRRSKRPRLSRRPRPRSSVGGSSSSSSSGSEPLDAADQDYHEASGGSGGGGGGGSFETQELVDSQQSSSSSSQSQSSSQSTTADEEDEEHEEEGDAAVSAGATSAAAAAAAGSVADEMDEDDLLHDLGIDSAILDSDRSDDDSDNDGGSDDSDATVELDSADLGRLLGSSSSSPGPTPPLHSQRSFPAGATRQQPHASGRTPPASAAAAAAGVAGAAGSTRTPDAPSSSSGAAAAGVEHHSLLLRLVDDFLYITTDLSAARRFVTTLHGQIPDYGCTVHQAKTQISFDMGLANHTTTTSSRGPSAGAGAGSGGGGDSDDLSSLRPTLGTFIPWCGLLLNTRTLEVQADYSRYLGDDFRLRDSFTVEASSAVGSTLRRRLYSFLRPKCHGVLLDTRINSVATVWLNIYQAFLLAAIKFHCYTRALPQRHFNVQFFTR